MTLQLETRFRCDRCGADESVVHQQGPGALPKLPEGWTRFWADDTIHQQNFCAGCSAAFVVFMGWEKAKAA